ncbi:MAG TPA: hypothetical protein VK901_06255 [Nitrospiraceae bacterium]|nr:hypothetical protein [Nitrospiraceae bacterium]
MVQLIIEVVIVGLLTALVWIIWMVVRASFDDDHYPDDKRQEKRELRGSPEQTQ